MPYRQAFALTLTAVLAVVISLTAVCSANQMTVYSCHDPAGNPLAHSGWSVAKTTSEDMTAVDSCTETGAGLFDEPARVAIDSGGNLWVTDTMNGRVQEVSATGSYLSQFGTVGVASGQLKEPRGIAIDSKGDLWVVDCANDRVQEFSSSGVYQSQFGTAGTGNGQFKEPRDMAIDPAGNLWVADMGNNRVQEFSSTGSYERQFGSEGTGNGQFKSPRAIAVDSAGHVWVSDTLNNRVQEFSSTGSYMSQFGTAGTGNGQLKEPKGIAFDAKGNVWVVDSANNRVQEFSAAGAYLAQFGTAGTGSGQFNAPWGIAIDPQHNFWVADSSNYRVQEFNEKREYVRMFGGLGGQGVLNAELAANPNGYPNNAAISWVFTAPSWSSISSYTLNLKESYAYTGLGQGLDLIQGADESTTYDYRNLGGGLQRAATVARTPPSPISSVTVKASCSAALICSPGVKIATASVASASFVLNDATVPSVGSVGGRLLSSSLITGTAEVNFLAFDSGPGVYSAWLVVDGTAQPPVLLNGSGGACVNLGQTSNGTRAFSSPDPCPVLASGTVKLNTAAFKDGPHTASLYIDDASGNQALAKIWEFTSRNAPFALSAPYISGTPAVGQTLSATNATFTAPAGAGTMPVASDQWLRCEPADQLYASDFVADRVQMWSQGRSAEGAFVDGFGEEGTNEGQLKSPVGLALNAEGDIWVADSANNRIEKFAPGGQLLAAYGTRGSSNGQFISPWAMAIDKTSGNVYVADLGNSRIEELTPAGEFIRAFGSYGTASGQLKYPSGVAIDSNGNVWVADKGNNRLEEFTATGTFVKAIGSAGSGEGQFSEPTGVTVSGPSVYVTDYGNDRVEQFSENGTYVAQFGQEGSKNGELIHPWQIATDPITGDLYVADHGNYRVQQFTPGREYVASIGVHGSGPGQFTSVSGVAATAPGEKCSPISGANAQTYTLTAQDANHVIVYENTASDSDGQTAAGSQQTLEVPEPPPPPPPPPPPSGGEGGQQQGGGSTASAGSGSGTPSTNTANQALVPAIRVPSTPRGPVQASLERALISLKVSPRAVKRNGRLGIVGSVSTPVPAGGEKVTLQIQTLAKHAGKWRTLAVVRTNRNGLFKVTYTLRLPRHARYRIRALTTGGQGYPYLPSTSAPIVITES
jgi:DNA-binding beta-propeller fold protein YncE